MHLSRRHSLRLALGAGLAAALPGIARPGRAMAAVEPLVLSWADLLPKASQRSGIAEFSLQGVVPHGGLEAPAQSEKPQLREELNGVLVKIPGYALPLQMENVGVTEFLLVPYIGACVHVPPPPANQLVMVNLEEPMVFNDLFEPVWVTGSLETSMSQIQGWIDIGYRMAADDVSPYTL